MYPASTVKITAFRSIAECVIEGLAMIAGFNLSEISHIAANLMFWRKGFLNMMYLNSFLKKYVHTFCSFWLKVRFYLPPVFRDRSVSSSYIVMRQIIKYMKTAFLLAHLLISREGRRQESCRVLCVKRVDGICISFRSYNLYYMIIVHNKRSINHEYLVRVMF